MWTNDITLEFLELYRTEQLLWDPKHPLHRNKSEVNDGWLRVQDSLSMNCSVVDLKKKKESLMTSFRLHWNRKKKSPDYRTTWFAYPLMESFLSEKYDCDSSTNDLEDEFFNSASGYTDALSDNNYDAAVSTPERSHTKQRQSSTSRPSPIDVKIHKDYHYIKKPIEIPIVKADVKNDKDEYELYGQLLAKKLRKLDEHQRDIAMHDIDNIMFRAKMQSGSHKTFSAPSPMLRKTKSPLFIISAQPGQGQYDEHYQEDPMNTEASS